MNTSDDLSIVNPLGKPLDFFSDLGLPLVMNKNFKKIENELDLDTEFLNAMFDSLEVFGPKNLGSKDDDRNVDRTSRLDLIGFGLSSPSKGYKGDGRNADRTIRSQKKYLLIPQYLRNHHMKRPFESEWVRLIISSLKLNNRSLHFQNLS